MNQGATVFKYLLEIIQYRYLYQKGQPKNAM